MAKEIPSVGDLRRKSEVTDDESDGGKGEAGRGRIANSPRCVDAARWIAKCAGGDDLSLTSM